MYSMDTSGLSTSWRESGTKQKWLVEKELQIGIHAKMWYMEAVEAVADVGEDKAH